MRRKFEGWIALALGLISVAAGTGGPAAVALVWLERAEFEAAARDRTAGGWRLGEFAAAAPAGEVRYAGVWEKTAGPVAEVAVGLEARELEAALAAKAGRGLWPRRLLAAPAPAGTRFGAVWEKGGAETVARLALTRDEFEREAARLSAAGFVLIDLAGSRLGGKVHYAGLFEKAAPRAQVLRLGRFGDDLAAEIAALAGQGLAPARLECVALDHRIVYSMVFERSGSGGREFWRRGEAKEFEAEARRRAEAGGRLVDFCVAGLGGKAVYAAIWERRD